VVAVDAYGPFDSGAGANITENTWRRFMRRMRGDLVAGRSGVIRDVANTCQVYDDNTGMQVKVKTGEVWIEGHWGEITAEKTVSIATADTTFARKDRIVAAADFVNNSIDVYAVTGTPAASPTIPAVTQDATKWEISLGIVDVPANDTSISSQTTDARHYLDLPHIAKVTNADVVVNNTTTTTDVTQLTFPVSSGRVYAIEGLFVYTASTAADAKVVVTGPSGASLRLAGGRLITGTTGTSSDMELSAAAISTSFVMGGAGTGNTIGVPVIGRLSTSDAGGNMQIGFAQNTADATNTTLVQGSWLKLTPMA